MQPGARVRNPEGNELEVVEVHDGPRTLGDPPREVAGPWVRVKLDEVGNSFGWYEMRSLELVREAPDDEEREV